MFVDDSYRSPNTNCAAPETQFPIITYTRGLCNPGVQCYMNSILQQLFYLPNFRENIITREIASPSSLSEQLLCL